MNIFLGAAIAILISLLLILFRGIIGKTIFDRMLAANTFGSAVVALIALLGAYIDTEFYLDIALLYALINFITTIAFLRYFQGKTELHE